MAYDRRPGAVSGATRALRCLWHEVHPIRYFTVFSIDPQPNPTPNPHPTTPLAPHTPPLGSERASRASHNSASHAAPRAPRLPARCPSRTLAYGL
eukprot:7100364-Prymnesium_polylepis.1